MMVIDNEFEIGELVYLKTDQEQVQRIVSALIVAKTYVGYELKTGTYVSSHEAFEIVKEKVLIDS
jgi:hypothetical protein